MNLWTYVRRMPTSVSSLMTCLPRSSSNEGDPSLLVGVAHEESTVGGRNVHAEDR